ncbi:hypothetical protein AU05_14805 [Ectopseudomonas composti]|uniref:Uncharacterized protein n=1 Tax=Ectopseudomonas composti TaxID=658457 RepID=A0ABN0SB98_9GAMM|nr:hypothetical protein [Pseudomonas composti]EZH79832.1 hypothetical protein AU05_14805 [Pseudomonas composti]
MKVSPEQQRQALRLQLAAQRQRLQQLLGADSKGSYPRSLTLRLLRAMPAQRVQLVSALAMLLGPRALRSFSLLLILGRFVRLLASGAPRQRPASALPKRLR